VAASCGSPAIGTKGNPFVASWMILQAIDLKGSQSRKRVWQKAAFIFCAERQFYCFFLIDQRDMRILFF
jgi:hypothetical protein